MKWPILCPLLLFFAATGCDDRSAPFAAYRHFNDAVVSKSGGLLGYPCDREMVIDDETIHVPKPAEQCYKMQPPKHYRGIWLDQFEGSLFFEGATSAADVKARYRKLLAGRFSDKEWLDFAEMLERRLYRDRDFAHARMFAIEFVGRRTAYKGRYGHMGNSDSLMIVDRIDEAKFLYLSPSSYLSNEFKQ